MLGDHDYLREHPFINKAWMESSHYWMTASFVLVTLMTSLSVYCSAQNACTVWKLLL